MFRPSGVYSYEEQKYIYYNDIENISIKYMEIAHSLTFWECCLYCISSSLYECVSVYVVFTF